MIVFRCNEGLERLLCNSQQIHHMFVKKKPHEPFQFSREFSYVSCQTGCDKKGRLFSKNINKKCWTKHIYIKTRPTKNTPNCLGPYNTKHFGLNSNEILIFPTKTWDQLEQFCRVWYVLMCVELEEGLCIMPGCSQNCCEQREALEIIRWKLIYLQTYWKTKQDK